MLQQAGFLVEAVAFERDYHAGRLPDCPVERLCQIAHGHYIQRILKIASALPTIRRAIRRNQIVYASGEDMAAAAFIAGLGLGTHIILEVGDIVDLQLSKGIMGRVFRIIDRYLVNKYRLLVVISPGFLDDYYRHWLKVKTPALVIENKLEASFVNGAIAPESLSQLPGKPLTDRPLRIGYFGLLRDEWSWQVLEKLAMTRPHDFEIIFAGLPINPSNLPERTREHANMEYRGEYRSPQDLSSLYNSVDMVWACYPHIGPNEWNLRWGRPNRFFESCFFRKPTFARAGCHFATDVEHYKIGMIIKDQEIGRAVNTICQIQSDDLMFWQDNLSKLPKSIYMYTTEGDDLAQAIREVAGVSLEPTHKI
jgi:succinoglycan biosynthesis protein ExoL